MVDLVGCIAVGMVGLIGRIAVEPFDQVAGYKAGYKAGLFEMVGRMVDYKVELVGRMVDYKVELVGRIAVDKIGRTSI